LRMRHFWRIVVVSRTLNLGSTRLSRPPKRPSLQYRVNCVQPTSRGRQQRHTVKT
jgi:hypothetical protein